MVRGQSITSGTVSHLVGVPICPDLLEWRDLGEADSARGRAVRLFFWFMRFWPI